MPCHKIPPSGRAFVVRLPRVRFTVRRMIVLVAFVASGFGIAREFGEGVPPRFVLRGIPDRIARLRPGMTRGQTREILGLGKSWIWGGTSATSGKANKMAQAWHETFYVRPLKMVGVDHYQEGHLSKIQEFRSAGAIHLRFRCVPGASPLGWSESDKLSYASFYIDGRTIAEMTAP